MRLPNILKSQIKASSLVVILLLCAAALVRFWGIDFGLPNQWCRPDESVIVNIFYSSFHHFRPESFNYPSLYKYMVLLLYYAYYYIGFLTKKYWSGVLFFVEFITEPRNFYLIDRCLSALLGVLTVLVVYKVTIRLWDKKTALFSAFFLSFAYLHVRDSHFGTVDVPVTFFIMCSMYYILKSREDATLKSYILSGILAGLAVSTKYNGIFLCAPILFVHAFNVFETKTSRAGKAFAKLFFDIRIMVFFTALVGAFVVGTPYCIIDPKPFIKDCLFEWHHLSVGNALHCGKGWWYHLRYSLLYGLGAPFLMVSFFGALVLVRKDVKKAIIFLAFPLIYYAVAGSGYTVFLRYVIPLVPFLCVTGAIGTAYTLEQIEGYCHKKIIIVVCTILLLLLVIGPSLFNILFFDTLLGRKDNRLVCADWMSGNLAKGSTFAQFCTYGRIQFYSDLDKRETDNAIAEVKNEPSGNTLRLRAPSNEWGYDKKLNTFVSPRMKGPDDLPRYIIVEESGLKVYSALSEAQRKILRDHYHLLKAFKASGDNQWHWFDQQDAFYLPLVGFSGIERPGPNLTIYEINAF